MASVDQVAPASELVSTVPSLSSAARWLPSAANASGDAATAASIGPPVDQEAPPFVVWASGENTRAWLGRTAMVSELAPPAEATSPPLSATPGGVTSFHDPEFPARANTSQNAGFAAMGTTAQLSVPAATEVAIETDAGRRQSQPTFPTLPTRKAPKTPQTRTPLPPRQPQAPHQPQPLAGPQRAAGHAS